MEIINFENNMSKDKDIRTVEARIVKVEYEQGNPEYYGELALPVCGGLFGNWLTTWTRVTPKLMMKDQVIRRLKDERYDWEREHNNTEVVEETL